MARGLGESINRGDLRVGFLLYAEDGETIYPPELVSLGFEARTHGREDRVEFQRRWSAEWGHFRNEPKELIDLGDRFVVLGRVVGAGSGSGAPFDREVAYLGTVQSGFTIREQIFFNHAEALEAAGLSK